MHAVLPESTDMSSTKPEPAALNLLRAVFDLSDADLRASADLLSRLCGLAIEEVDALIAQLRARKLVQADSFQLTMVGLATAVALPEFEPCSEPVPRRCGLRAA